MNRSWKWTSWFVAVSLSALTGCATLSAPKPRMTAAQAANPMAQQLAMANLAEKSGQLERAKQFYKAVLRMDRGNAEAFHRLGVIAARQGQFQQAEAHFQQALAAAPQNVQVQSDAGYALYLQGRYAEAETMLRQVVTSDPGNKKALNNLGLAIGRQGRYRESLDVFRQGGGEAAACNNLAYLCSQAGDYQQAQSLYSRALTLDPGMKPAVEALIQVAQINQREQHIPGDALPPDGGTTIASATMPQGPSQQIASAELVQPQSDLADPIEEVRDLPYEEPQQHPAMAADEQAVADAPTEENLEAALQAAQQIERPRPSRRRAQHRTVSLPRTAQPTNAPTDDEALGHEATDAAATDVEASVAEPLPIIVDNHGAPVAPQSAVESGPESSPAPAAETWRAEIVYGRRQSTIEPVARREAEDDSEPGVASVSDSSPAPAAPLPAPEAEPRRLVPPREPPASNPLRSATPDEDATTQSEEHVAKGHYQFAQYTEADGEEQSIVAPPPQRVLGPEFRRQRPVASAALTARLRNAAGTAEDSAEAADGATRASEADEAAPEAAGGAEQSASGQTLAERVRHWRQTRQR